MRLPEMGVVFVVSMPFTVSPFACAMIDHSGFTQRLSASVLQERRSVVECIASSRDLILPIVC